MDEYQDLRDLVTRFEGLVGHQVYRLRTENYPTCVPPCSQPCMPQFNQHGQWNTNALGAQDPQPLRGLTCMTHTLKPLLCLMVNTLNSLMTPVRGASNPWQKLKKKEKMRYCLNAARNKSAMFESQLYKFVNPCLVTTLNRRSAKAACETERICKTIKKLRKYSRQSDRCSQRNIKCCDLMVKLKTMLIRQKNEWQCVGRLKETMAIADEMKSITKFISQLTYLLDQSAMGGCRRLSPERPPSYEITCGLTDDSYMTSPIRHAGDQTFNIASCFNTSGNILSSISPRYCNGMGPIVSQSDCTLSICLDDDDDDDDDDDYDDYDDDEDDGDSGGRRNRDERCSRPRNQRKQTRKRSKRTKSVDHCQRRKRKSHRSRQASPKNTRSHSDSQTSCTIKLSSLESKNSPRSVSHPRTSSKMSRRRRCELDSRRERPRTCKGSKRSKSTSPKKQVIITATCDDSQSPDRQKSEDVKSRKRKSSQSPSRHSPKSCHGSLSEVIEKCLSKCIESGYFNKSPDRLSKEYKDHGGPSVSHGSKPTSPSKQSTNSKSREESVKTNLTKIQESDSQINQPLLSNQVSESEAERSLKDSTIVKSGESALPSVIEKPCTGSQNRSQERTSQAVRSSFGKSPVRSTREYKDSDSPRFSHESKPIYSPKLSTNFKSMIAKCEALLQQSREENIHTILSKMLESDSQINQPLLSNQVSESKTDRTVKASTIVKSGGSALPSMVVKSNTGSQKSPTVSQAASFVSNRSQALTSQTVRSSFEKSPVRPTGESKDCGCFSHESKPIYSSKLSTHFKTMMAKCDTLMQKSRGESVKTNLTGIPETDNQINQPLLSNQVYESETVQKSSAVSSEKSQAASLISDRSQGCGRSVLSSQISPYFERVSMTPSFVASAKSYQSAESGGFNNLYLSPNMDDGSIKSNSSQYGSKSQNPSPQNNANTWQSSIAAKSNLSPSPDNTRPMSFATAKSQQSSNSDGPINQDPSTEDAIMDVSKPSTGTVKSNVSTNPFRNPDFFSDGSNAIKSSTSEPERPMQSTDQDGSNNKVISGGLIGATQPTSDIEISKNNSHKELVDTDNHYCCCCYCIKEDFGDIKQSLQNEELTLEDCGPGYGCKDIAHICGKKKKQDHLCCCPSDTPIAIEFESRDAKLTICLQDSSSEMTSTSRESSSQYDAQDDEGVPSRTSSSTNDERRKSTCKCSERSVRSKRSSAGEEHELSKSSVSSVVEESQKFSDTGEEGRKSSYSSKTSSRKSTTFEKSSKNSSGSIKSSKRSSSCKERKRSSFLGEGGDVYKEREEGSEDERSLTEKSPSKSCRSSAVEERRRLSCEDENELRSTRESQRGSRKSSVFEESEESPYNESPQSMSRKSSKREECEKSPFETPQSVSRKSSIKEESEKSPYETPQSMSRKSSIKEESEKSPYGSPQSMSRKSSIKEESAKSPFETPQSMSRKSSLKEESEKSPYGSPQSMSRKSSIKEESEESPYGSPKSISRKTSFREESEKSPYETPQSMSRKSSIREGSEEPPDESSQSTSRESSVEEESEKSPYESLQSTRKSSIKGGYEKSSIGSQQSMSRKSSIKEEYSKSPYESPQSTSRKSSFKEEYEQSPYESPKDMSRIPSIKEEYEKSPYESQQSMSRKSSIKEEYEQSPYESPQDMSRKSSIKEEYDSPQSISRKSSIKEESVKSPYESPQGMSRKSSIAEEEIESPHDSDSPQDVQSPQESRHTMSKKSSVAEESVHSPYESQHSMSKKSSIAEQSVHSPYESQQSMSKKSSIAEQSVHSPYESQHSMSKKSSVAEQSVHSPYESQHSMSKKSSVAEQSVHSPYESQHSMSKKSSVAELSVHSPYESQHSMSKKSSVAEQSVHSPYESQHSMSKKSSVAEQSVHSPYESQHSMSKKSSVAEQSVHSPYESQHSMSKKSSVAEQSVHSPYESQHSMSKLPSITERSEESSYRETRPTTTKKSSMGSSTQPTGVPMDSEFNSRPSSSKELSMQVSEKRKSSLQQAEDRGVSFTKTQFQAEDATTMDENMEFLRKWWKFLLLIIVNLYILYILWCLITSPSCVGCHSVIPNFFMHFITSAKRSVRLMHYGSATV